MGCVAELTEVVPHPDGRYDIVTVGSRRFRLKEIDRTLPYLRGEVEFLPEEPGAEPESAARRARHQFRLYRQRLGMMGIGGTSGPGSGPEGDEGAEGSGPDGLPADPVRLSHFIAASMVLDGHEKQRLLEAEDATLRLRAERELLARENRLLDVLPAVPMRPVPGRLVHLQLSIPPGPGPPGPRPVRSAARVIMIAGQNGRHERSQAHGE